MLDIKVSSDNDDVKITISDLVILHQRLTLSNSREFQLTRTEARSLLADLHWAIYHEREK